MDFIALAQAGPVAILLVFIGAMVIAFAKGTVVPGWLYKQERDQRIKAEALLALNAEALTVLAKAAANGVANGQRRPARA